MKFKLKKTGLEVLKNGFNQAELGIRLELFYSPSLLFYRFWQTYFDFFFTKLGV